MRYALAGWLVFGVALPLGAQATDSRLAFEVATVKPAAPPSPQNLTLLGIHGGPGTADPGQMTFGFVQMQTLLMKAYGVSYLRISGPSWLDTESYDIVAKVPPETTLEQVNVMLQNLLVERFGLVAHHETKEMQVYELTVAKGGLKIKESVEDPDAAAKPDDSAPIKRDKNGVPEYPGNKPGWGLVGGGPDGRLFMTGRKQPLSVVFPNLEARWGHVIVDKTGLTGKYDFAMEFAGPLPVAPGGPTNGAVNSASDPPPSLAAIMQRDLGVKLEEKKAPVDVLVIDHVNKVPTEN